MTLRDELPGYINTKYGLVGITPNGVGFSTRNVLLDTGTAYVLLSVLGQIMLPQDKTSLINAFNSCRNPPNEFFSTLPGTNDHVSHDDVIGIVAGSCAVMANADYALTDILVYGEEHLWVLSTDGTLYWDAVTKPWHKAYYYLAIGEQPWIGGKLMFAAAMLIDAYFNKNSSSDKKLMWLMTKTAAGRSRIVDFAIKIWNSRLKVTFGSMKNVFKTYYGENHIFTRYCNE